MSITPAIELKLYDHTQGPRKIGPKDGKFVKLMSVGVRFMAWGEETGGGFSLVEHPIAPNTLAAPVHSTSARTSTSTCSRGAWARCSATRSSTRRGGLRLQAAQPVAHVLERRRQPCRILEIISPSGFEHFFDELAELVAQPDFSPEKIIALGERYGHYFDLERTAAVVEEHGLHFPMPE